MYLIPIKVTIQAGLLSNTSVYIKGQILMECVQGLKSNNLMEIHIQYHTRIVQTLYGRASSLHAIKLDMLGEGYSKFGKILYISMLITFLA